MKHHYDIQLEYGKYPERPYDSPAIWGDSKKIEKISGEKKQWHNYTGEDVTIVVCAYKECQYLENYIQP